MVASCLRRAARHGSILEPPWIQLAPEDAGEVCLLRNRVGVSWLQGLGLQVLGRSRSQNEKGALMRASREILVV